jgi:peptide chain release factor 1
MKPSIRQKLDKLSERFEEVGRLMAEPDVHQQQNRFRDLSVEYARLEPSVQRYREYLRTELDLKTAQDMANDPDADARDLGMEEARLLQAQLLEEELELKKLLVPKDGAWKC